MVADEVICGFGRTGNMWGSQTFNIKPDLLTCAKALSSSYLPISAVLISDDLYTAVRDQSGELGGFSHGYTYSGHPVPAAVALETLKIYEERDIVGHVQRVGPTMQARLREFSDHPLVGEVRGVGLLAGVEVMADGANRLSFNPAAKVGPKVQALCEENGLLIRAMGDSIGFCPPLIIDEATIEKMLAQFDKSLDQTLDWARQEGLV